MNTRLLGKTGIRVSEIAFGGVEIGIPYGIGVQNAADMISEAEAINLLDASFDSGINFYDTARQYGQSESIIGKAFQHKREKVVIATKCRHFLDEDSGIPSYPQLKKIIETSLKESLHALRTDYVDVFMLHQGTMQLLENEDILRIFSDLKQTGLIRSTGVSTYTPAETERSIDLGTWDVIQLPFNLMDQRQAALFSSASRKGVGIVVRSILMKGLLSDRATKLHPALTEVENHIKHYKDLLDQEGMSLSTLATKFGLAFPEISSILIGLDRVEYLNKCLDACDGNCLGTELLSRAQQLAYHDPDFLNLQTWSKRGWLK